MTPTIAPLRRVAGIAAAAAIVMSIVSASPAGATPPDKNGLILFRSDTGSGDQIYTVRSNGHDLRQLTHLDGAALQPHWSPDGRRIGFEFDHPEGTGCATVAVMNPDGSHLVDLTTPNNPPGWDGCEGAPTFTPDGTRIVFERYDALTNDDAIWSMNLAGTDRRRTAVGNATDPEVSPDGSMLSYVAFGGGDFQQALGVSRIDGSDAHLLTSFDADVAIKQDWSPDGKHITFTDNADVDASANVATIRPDGTGLRYLTHYTGGELRAYVGSYSPDGRWIVYRLEDHGQYALIEIRPDGSQSKTIMPLSDFRPRGMAWGPHTDGPVR
jgi:Tol biopolymer transport system component